MDAAVTDAICARIASGESLREICRSEGMPDEATVYRWLAKPDQTELREKYARAREAQMERFAEEILEIADDGTNDWMVRQQEGGVAIVTPDHEHMQRSRLRVDSRKWLMSKLAPKKYGDKITQEIGGTDGGPIVVTTGVPRSNASG